MSSAARGGFARRAATPRPDWTWSDKAIARWAEGQLSRAPRDPRLPGQLKKWFDRLKADKCDVGAHCEQLMVRVHAKHGNVRTALAMADTVEDLSKVSESVAYAFARREDFTTLCAIAAQEQKKHGKLSRGVYRAFLKYYSLAGGAVEADAIIDRMKAAGYALSPTHHKLRLLACRTREEAEARVPARADVDVGPRVIKEMIAQCCLKGGDVDAGKAILDELERHGHTTSTQVMNVYAEALGAAGRLDDIMDIAARCGGSSSSSSNSSAADPPTVVLAMLTCLRQHIDNAANKHPEFNVYVRFAEAFFAPYQMGADGGGAWVDADRAGDAGGDAAAAWYTVPNSVLTDVYGRMIDVYCAAGLPERAGVLLGAMKGTARMVVTPRLLQVVSAAYRRSGDLEAARAVQATADDMKPRDIAHGGVMDKRYWEDL